MIILHLTEMLNILAGAEGTHVIIELQEILVVIMIELALVLVVVLLVEMELATRLISRLTKVVLMLVILNQPVVADRIIILLVIIPL